MEEDVLNERLAGADHVPIHNPSGPSRIESTSCCISPMTHPPPSDNFFLQHRQDQLRYKRTKTKNSESYKRNWQCDPACVIKGSKLLLGYGTSTEALYSHLSTVTIPYLNPHRVHGLGLTTTLLSFPVYIRRSQSSASLRTFVWIVYSYYIPSTSNVGSDDMFWYSTVPKRKRALYMLK